MNLRKFLVCLTAALILAAPMGVGAQQLPNSDVAAQTLIDACTYGIKTDITDLHLTRSQLEDLFYQLQNSGKLPWYIDDTYTYYYDTDTNQALEFEPAYLDESIYNRVLYEQKAAQFLQTYVHEGMDPVQMALSIHDGLAVSCIYDETLEKNTGYDLLVNGSTVCAGYAQAYQDLLARVGIESVVVTSEAMEHAWNLVQLDGQWYHVDVTWDDPSPDSYGFVNHDYFLLTDEEISAGDDPHHDWETDITCTDTRFADSYWRDIDSQICFTDSQTAYYMRTEDWVNDIIARDVATGEEDVIYTEDADYLDIGQGDYCYAHGSLSLWNGRLYYNKMNALISMDTDGGDHQTEYSYDTAGNGQVLYACYVNEDTLYATTADHEGDTSSFTTELSPTGYHVHSYTESAEAPACTEAGYTLYICDCGLTAKCNIVAPAGHSYEKIAGEPATFWGSGWEEETCSVCNDTTVRHLPQIDIAEWIGEHSGISAAVVIGIIALCSKVGKKKVKT